MSNLAIVEKARNTVIEACVTTEFAKHSFDQLGSLFDAIMRVADKDSAAHSLASIGFYLCGDWEATHHDSNSRLAKQLETLKKAG